MDLYDDAALAKRNLVWHDVDEGDYVVAIKGFASNMGYLAHTLQLETAHRKTIEFRGGRPDKRGREFGQPAQAGEEIIDVKFEKGTCTQIMCTDLVKGRISPKEQRHSPAPPVGPPPRIAGIPDPPPGDGWSEFDDQGTTWWYYEGPLGKFWIQPGEGDDHTKIQPYPE